MEPIDYFLGFILNPLFLISLTFWIIVIIFVYLLRNKKEAYTFFFPLLILFKTKKLNKLIMRISRKKPKIWRIFWNIGIFFSFSITIFALFYFFINLINLIFQPSIEQAIVPLIPGVTVELPVFLYFILPILFIMTTHEFAHGISASIDGVEIKSTGVLGLGFFYLVGFGAFVEVDERKLRSKKFHRNTRLRIAAAGTYVNGITAAIAFILLINFATLISPFYVQVPQIANVLSTDQGGFNEGKLDNGDAILSIKNQGEPNNLYINLDYNKGIDLTAILNNETRIKCEIGNNLTFKVYNTLTDSYAEKNVTLGPRYYLGLEYQELNETAITITYNYTSNQPVNITITKINSTDINKTTHYTLGAILTEFNLKTLNLTSSIGENYIIDIQVTGVYVGVQTIPYWMHKNDFAKFFTSNWPDFWLREIYWLFVISLSITIFNMLPLPIFDGDRLIKEIINWGFGEDYSSIRKKKDRFLYKPNEPECELSEYRVKAINEVKIILEDSEETIQLSSEKYELVDHTGDGFKDTVMIKVPDNTSIKEKTVFEIAYEYFYDNKIKQKRLTLNTLRIFSLIILIGNFLVTFLKFGFHIFWL